jgi:Phage integrase family/Helix-turn-helix domain of resolvase
VLGVEDWAEIRRLHRAEQMPIKQVARVLGVSKNTVKRALAADGPPTYQRPARGSIVDQVEPRIRELLQAWPTIPATLIAERIGCTRSLTVLKDRVRELRPVYLPPIRLHDVRHSYATAALAAGIPAKVVSERLGHANIAITLDVYSHVIPGMDAQAANTVASLILDGSSPSERPGSKSGPPTDK